MVLPGGIEPPTSPLPMECSTPELRQQRASYIVVGGVKKAIFYSKARNFCQARFSP